MINAILMNPKDNVVTLLKDVAKGETVSYRAGEEVLSIKAREDIPFCHKIALKDIQPEEDVIKYGETIGKASELIPKGHWAADHNIVSVPRDYEAEMI